MYPTPYSSDPASKPLALSTSSLEASVRSVHAAAEAWLRPRSPLKLEKEVVGSHWPLVSIIRHLPIRDMRILLDRWVVVVYQEGSYELWDLFPHDDGSAELGLPQNGAWSRRYYTPVRRVVGDIRGPCSSSAACVDPEGGSILIAMAKEVRYRTDVNAFIS